jgi:hypothetical protein
MTGDWSDDEIKNAFAEMRASDTDEAPRFDATYAAAQARVARRASVAPWKRAAMAASVLLVAVLGWLSLQSQLAQSPSRLTQGRIRSLSEWRSPTAFLLQGPSDLLIRTVPTISATSADLNALGVRAGHRRPS